MKNRPRPPWFDDEIMQARRDRRKAEKWWRTTGLASDLGLESGVPQGSCLGPLLYSIYASKRFSVIKSHLPSAHSYADDTQLYLSFCPLESTCEAEKLDAMEKCITDVCSWMINDKLMLNDDNTEFLVIGTSKQLHISKVSVSSISVGDVYVIPAYTAKNLGSWFESHMVIATHITKDLW